MALRLCLVTLGAVFGALTVARVYAGHRLDYAGVAGVLCFVAVLGVRMTMQSDPDLEAAEPRANAVADLVTSQAWRYAVGAYPYPVGTQEQDRIAREQLAAILLRYQQVLGEYSATASVSGQITDEMRRLRAASLAQRHERYLSGRVEPLQQGSYVVLGRLAHRLRTLTALVLLVELIGIPVGIAEAIGVSSIDLLGVTAAAAASLALWVETLNFAERRRAASAVANNLVAVPRPAGKRAGRGRVGGDGGEDRGAAES